MAEKEPTDTVMNMGQSSTEETKGQQQAQGQSSKKDKKKDKKKGGASPQDASKKGQGQSGKADGAADGQGQGEAPKTQKSKAELKAERRALQEAQRAAKASKKAESAGSGGKEGSAPGTAAVKKEPKRVPDQMKADDEETQKKVAKKLVKQQIPQRITAQRKVRLFNHLHQYERDYAITKSLKFSSSSIHPAIVKLGVQYAEGTICGSNARCLAMLAALKLVVMDYTTPPQKEMSRDLEAKIKPYISFLNQCRLMSVSMGNAIKHIKWHISHIPQDKPEQEAKRELLEVIDEFVKIKILFSGKLISDHVRDEKKITDGDVIVTYGCSSLVKKVLCDAHKEGIQFRVIVVDGRPRLEGKELARRLVRAGIKCSYVLINAASYAMQEATKVFLGAHAMLANGGLMSRVGSSLIALIAKSYNVPVLVCCETYKFCERGQTDSFVFNELGDPDDLIAIGNKQPYLIDWRDHGSLTLLNLVYDVTPQEFISVVITELGLIPCTSVPVVLRMNQMETNET